MSKFVKQYVLIFDFCQGFVRQTKCVLLDARSLKTAKKQAQEYIDRERKTCDDFGWAKLFSLTEEVSVQLNIQEELKVITKEELETLHPLLQRPKTDQGYESGYPFYLDQEGGTVVAYDCEFCGIVLGRLHRSGHMQEIKYVCELCKRVIYQEELHS